MMPFYNIFWSQLALLIPGDGDTFLSEAFEKGYAHCYVTLIYCTFFPPFCTLIPFSLPPVSLHLDGIN